MILYALPDFTVMLSWNLTFAGMMREAPEMFFSDVKSDCLYGCFPGCIMNGGRMLSGGRASYEQISKTFDAIEEAGLGIRITFTNMLVRPEHFEDEYANTILRAARGRNARIIVWSDELGEYISGRYNLGLILSTTRELKGTDELNEMLRRYDMAVLDYNHNKDDAFLQQIACPEKLEVLANEMCAPGCKVRQQHYLAESRSQMERKPVSFTCPGQYEMAGFTTQAVSSPTILSNEDIRRLHKIYGISHFKLVGRKNDARFFYETYLYYLVRPEYRSVMAKIVQKHL